VCLVKARPMPMKRSEKMHENWGHEKVVCLVKARPMPIDEKESR